MWRGLGPPSSLPGSTAGLYGLESVQGYDFPLSERWSNLSQDVLGERGLARELPTKTAPIPTGATLIALRMLGVRYYLAPPGYPSPSPLLRRTYAGADATVFADARALPRAYLVPHTRSMTDAAALAALRRGAVDPRRTALVPPGVAGPPGHGFSDGDHSAGRPPALARRAPARRRRMARVRGVVVAAVAGDRGRAGGRDAPHRLRARRAAGAGRGAHGGDAVRGDRRLVGGRRDAHGRPGPGGAGAARARPTAQAAS